MSTMTRAELIAQAISDGGRKGQSISLTNPFDFILKDMSRRYPVLRNVMRSFTTVASQAWVALPTDFRSWEQCFYDDDELDWMEPEKYFNYIRSETDTASTPSKFTIVKDEKRLYMWPKPSGAATGYLYYAAYHPKANRTLAFTSGGTYEVKVLDTVTGATSARTMVVDFIRVTSGSWAGGDAVGSLVGTPSGVYVSETLNVGSNTNVATIAADAATTDNFQHFFGEEFDDTIILGLLWRLYIVLAGMDSTVKIGLARDAKVEYLQSLSDAAGLKNRRVLSTGYEDF